MDWQHRAAAVGAWRELSGYDHPADPIGPEPVSAAPDVRGMPDGLLLHLRDTYPLETA